jgi:hypothetical protein
MNSDTIYPQPASLEDASAESISKAGAIFACMRNGMSVAREARRLYAMSDETLRQEGLTRENIPAHLASLL